MISNYDCGIQLLFAAVVMHPFACPTDAVNIKTMDQNIMVYNHYILLNSEMAHCMQRLAYCLISYLHEKESHPSNGPLRSNVQCMRTGFNLNTINLGCQPPTMGSAPPRTQNSFATMMSGPLATASDRDSTNLWRQ